MSDAKERGDPEGFLGRVYGAQSRAELRGIYDDWAESYEEDLVGWGYIGPSLNCGLISRHVAAGDGPILDAACGPGNLGNLLYQLGFRNLIGIDISEAMLAKAEARGIYQACRVMTLGEPLDFPSDHFAAAVAAGVFTAGHAGPEGFDELVRVVRPGGHLIFSLSSAVYEAQGFKAKLDALEAAKAIAPVDSTDWTFVITRYPGDTPPRHRLFVYRVL